VLFLLGLFISMALCAFDSWLCDVLCWLLRNVAFLLQSLEDLLQVLTTHRHRLANRWRRPLLAVRRRENACSDLATDIIKSQPYAMIGGLFDCCE